MPRATWSQSGVEADMWTKEAADVAPGSQQGSRLTGGLRQRLTWLRGRS